MEIDIREATPDDQPIIADFNSRMAEETEGRKLDPALIQPGVAALLDDPTKGRYWIATCGDDVAGQIMVTYEWSDWRNGMLWWIQSVFVPAEYRRKGVYSALYRHVEKIARDEGAGGIRLYVEKSNQTAQDTYRKLGMAEPGYLVMESIFEN